MDIKNINEIRPYLDLLNKDKSETMRGKVLEVKDNVVTVAMTPTISVKFELAESIKLKKGADILVDPVKGTLFATNEQGALVEVEVIKPTRGCTTKDRDLMHGQF